MVFSSLHLLLANGLRLSICLSCSYHHQFRRYAFQEAGELFLGLCECMRNIRVNTLLSLIRFHLLVHVLHALHDLADFGVWRPVELYIWKP